MGSRHDTIKRAFSIQYKNYLDAFDALGVDLSIRVIEKRKKKFVKITLVPQKAKKTFYGKSFYTKPLKAKNNFKLATKDVFLELFLKRQRLLLQKASPEKACSENLFNLLIRCLFIWRAESIPQKYKKHDIRIFYAIFYLLLLAILSILIAHNEVQAAKNFGWFW